MFAIKEGLLTRWAVVGKLWSHLEVNKWNLVTKSAIFEKKQKGLRQKNSPDIMENRLPFQLSFYLFCILTSNTPCNLIFLAFDVAVETWQLSTA